MAHSDCIDRIADGRQSAIDKKDKVLESANVSMVVSSLIVSTAAQKVQCMSNQWRPRVSVGTRLPRGDYGCRCDR